MLAGGLVLVPNSLKPRQCRGSPLPAPEDRRHHHRLDQCDRRQPLAGPRIRHVFRCTIHLPILRVQASPASGDAPPERAPSPDWTADAPEVDGL